MKRADKITITIQQSQKGSNGSMNCSCEILLDTSLSNVGDSDCQCSDCLEANLNAFNQFKDQEDVKTYHTIRHLPKEQRLKNTMSVIKTKKQCYPNRNSSTDRLKIINRNIKKQQRQQQKQKKQNEQIDEIINRNKLTDNQLNDFLLITKNRTRKYLNLIKKLQNNQKDQKNSLKNKIKKNLQLLKYTSQLIRDNNNDKFNYHQYKWNHSIYTCQCNGKMQKNGKNHDCCRRIKEKKSLNTNLEQFQPNFLENRTQILEQRKKKREQEKIIKQQHCLYDKNKNNHNRTDKQKIKKIERKILKNIEKYYQQLKKKKEEKQEKQRIRQSKLRGIDLKSKQLLNNSKKINYNNQSKTSFKLSIDHFDTFSQMKQENNKKNIMKNYQKQFNKNGNNNQELLEKKIYQDLDQQINSYVAHHPQQNIILKRTTKAEAPQYRSDQKQIYERIAYDAQIKPPTDLKSHPKLPKATVSQLNKKKKEEAQKTNNFSRGKEERKKKELEEQIEKKKKQIFQQYQKRNSNKPKNKQLRKQYEQKIKQQTKNPKYQVRVYDDPFLQEYEYREQPESKPRGQNMEIFTENVQSLKSKTKLKV